MQAFDKGVHPFMPLLFKSMVDTTYEVCEVCVLFLPDFKIIFIVVKVSNVISNIFI